MITEAVELPIHFPLNNLFSVYLYVTSLDPSCSVVLRHNWLTCHNPLIDWVSGSITFQTSEQVDLTKPPTAETCTTAAKSRPAEIPLKLVRYHISYLKIYVPSIYILL